jgi:hypothetical protein
MQPQHLQRPHELWRQRRFYRERFHYLRSAATA